MEINTNTAKIPCWFVWGWSIKDGSMILLSCDLEYKFARYHYEVNKNDPNFLRVYIEPSLANHSYNKPVQDTTFEMFQQDIDNSWQDKFHRLKTLTSSLIRAIGNNQMKKAEKLALDFKHEFGLSQVEWKQYSKE